MAAAAAPNNGAPATMSSETTNGENGGGIDRHTVIRQSNARLEEDEILHLFARICSILSFKVFHQLTDLGWVDLNLGCSTNLHSCSAISAEIPSA